MSDLSSHGAKRKAAIIAAGLSIWRLHGAAAVTSYAIGKRIGLTHSAVLYHFGSAESMREAIALEAVRIGCPTIVPQLIVGNHLAVASLDQTQRLRFLTGQ